MFIYCIVCISFVCDLAKVAEICQQCIHLEILHHHETATNTVCSLHLRGKQTLDTKLSSLLCYKRVTLEASNLAQTFLVG